MKVTTQLFGLMLVIGTIALPRKSTAQKLKIKNLPEVVDNGSNCDTSSYKLVFQDEFGGDQLDDQKWYTYFPYTSDGSDRGEQTRHIGTINSIFSDDMVSVKDGLLRLAVEARSNTWYTVTKEHKGSAIRSKGVNALYTFGRFEMRARLPKGGGLWPAFWMFGGETEIDVLEMCGERPSLLKTSLHSWGSEHYSITGKYKGVDHSLAFHTYAVEWDRDELRWYVDGQQVYVRGRFVNKRGKSLPGCDREAGNNRIAPYFPRPEDKVSIIANNNVGEPKGYCNGPKTPKPWPEESTMLVDYIRVYQRVPEKELTDLCSFPRSLTVENGTRIRTRETREIQLNGAFGSIVWATSPGLEIVDTKKNSVVIRAKTLGQQWVRSTSTLDPCPNAPAIIELQLEVVE